MRCREVLDAAAARIGGGSPRADAELLLAHALGRDRSWLFAHLQDSIEPAAARAFEALIARRVAGEPVAYLLGRRGFWTLDLVVSPEVLVPRPETELLVEFALEHLSSDATHQVLDLGTGSGAIALAVARERPRSMVTALDVSEPALAVAAANARALGLDNVSLLRGSWWKPLLGRQFDLVLSNPPYIPEHDPHLLRGDLRFEPRLALAAGHDGLCALREIVEHAPTHLRPGAWIALEHGYDQASCVRALLAANGFAEIATLRDLAGHERVSVGRLPAADRAPATPLDA